MDTNKMICDALRKLHFVGRNHFRIDETADDQAFERKLTGMIDAAITELVLTGELYEPPKLTEQDYCLLRLEIIKGMLEAKGISRDVIDQFFEAASDAADNAIRQHRQHIENDFTVIK